MKNIFTPCKCYNNATEQSLLEESGFDRIKRMYSLNEFGWMSPEMHYLIQSTSTTVVISSFIGGVINMGKVKNDYLRKNVASTFESEYLARRNLTDNMSLGALKGALNSALKYGSFSSLYLLSTMTVANYRNKITIWEHIGSGALLAAMFRINYGPKGMAAAASLGAVLGTFAGGALVFSMWIMNKDLQDIRNMQSEVYYERKRQKAHS